MTVTKLKYIQLYFTYLMAVTPICVVGKGRFERTKKVDLTKNYGDYEISIATARSIIECTANCYTTDDCKAFFVNHKTDECIIYNVDISQIADGCELPSGNFSFFKEISINLLAGRGNHSWQVSQITPSEGFAYLALDGNISPWWSVKSCTHTGESKNPWWAVDIGGLAKIQEIRIYQRKDTCCVDRFRDIKFRVGTSFSDVNDITAPVTATYDGPAGITPFPIVIKLQKPVRG